MAIVYQNSNNNLKYNALQLELNILKQKNKTLSDLCSEYTSKYRALVSKTTMMELENRSLKEELEQQNEINRKHNQTSIANSILKSTMNRVQNKYDKLLFKHKELQDKYKSAQHKIKKQTDKLDTATHKSVELELKYNESNLQLVKKKSLINHQNITISNLQAELELGYCNTAPTYDNLKVTGFALQRSETLTIQKQPLFSKLNGGISNSNISTTFAMVDTIIYPRYSTINRMAKYSHDYWTDDMI
eukprot:273351_1